MKQQSALDRRQACRPLGTRKAAPAGPDATWMAFPIEPGQQQQAGPETGSAAALQAALLVLRQDCSAGKVLQQDRGS